MNELKDQINQVIQEIQEITEYLYQQKISQGYTKLNVTLNTIMNLMDQAFQLKSEGKIQFNEETLVASLTNAMKAMEEKDYVLLADILLYEIAEQLEQIEL